MILLKIRKIEIRKMASMFSTVRNLATTEVKIIPMKVPSADSLRMIPMMEIATNTVKRGGLKYNRMPSVGAIPRPPWKARKMGKQCPITMDNNDRLRIKRLLVSIDSKNAPTNPFKKSRIPEIIPTVNPALLMAFDPPTLPVPDLLTSTPRKSFGRIYENGILPIK